MGDTSETDMPDRGPIGDRDILHRRPTCLIGDPSKTDMPHRRLRCLWRPIGDRHACGVQSEYKHIYLNKLIFIYFLLIYIGIM